MRQRWTWAALALNSLLIGISWSACVTLEVVTEPAPAPALVAPAPAPAPVTAAPVTAAPVTPDTSSPAAPVTTPVASTLPSPLAGATTQQLGPVRLESLAQYNPIPQGAQTTLNLLVRLGAEGQPSTERPNLDLAIVLDRSGSMAGAKLQDAKQAGLELIKRLTPQDKVTLITYDDSVMVNTARLAVDAAGYDTLRSALLAVTEGGSTALGPALMKSLDLLEPANRPEKDIAHVVLLSDGLANVGEQRPDVLGLRAAQGFSRGVSVSTLGVGLDYNEDLMTRLADQGGGRYHFIKDSAAVTSVLSEELAGLSSTVSREIVLTLTPSPAVTGVTAFGYPSEVKDGVTHVRVGSLRAGQSQELVLRLQVAATQAGPLSLGSLGLSYKNVPAGGVLVTGQQAVAVNVSADDAQVRAAERTEVTVRVAEVEAAELLDQAARQVEQRNYDNARQLLNTNIEQIRSKARATNSKKLEEQANELERTLKDVDMAEQDEKSQKSFTKSQKARSYQMKK
ncbi:MAG: VWA domain-containing protein [Myxococcota bacterium]